MSDSTPALPQEFLRRLSTVLPEKSVDLVLEAMEHTRPTTFRVNTIKTNAEALIPALNSAGFACVQVAWFSDAYILTHGTQRALSETSQYKSGELYVQSLSSMLPPIILDPKPGDRILDIAAAPGSKTTQMAAHMDNRGEIVANDTSQARIYRLKANLILQGATIAHISRDDGRAIWKRYTEYFDKVLVDVPCSMEGRFNSNDPKSYQDWSVKKVKELSHLQCWMLRSAISATRPGGTIVYSTCTLSPEENEEVLSWILEKEKGNVIMEEIRFAGDPFDPAILKWGTKNFDHTISKSARIYPTATMEGFYIAKRKKIRTSVSKPLAV